VTNDDDYFVMSDGRYLALEDGTSTAKALDSPDDVEPGWHVATCAEWDRWCEEITLAAIGLVAAERAPLN